MNAFSSSSANRSAVIERSITCSSETRVCSSIIEAGVGDGDHRLVAPRVAV
jgi:hypothetical protein